MKRSYILLSAAFLFFSISLRGQGLSFQENKGQVSDQYFKPRPDVLFSGNAGELVFHLRKTGISYQMYKVEKWKSLEKKNLPLSSSGKLPDSIPEKTISYRLDVNWLNADPKANVVKNKTCGGYSNFYSTVCPNGVQKVRNYKEVIYQESYPGIDLKWFEKEGSLKYEYVVQPHADYKVVVLEVNGAEQIQVNKDGELEIRTPFGKIVEHAPFVTQQGKKLNAHWKINRNQVSFEIEKVDPNKELIIDPLIRYWGTFFGQGGRDVFWNGRSDKDGNLYCSGNTDSPNNIASIGAFQTVYGGNTPSNWYGDAILAKFDKSGNRIWCTYYGGNGGEAAYNCAINSTGSSILMVGLTSTSVSAAISTSGCHQPNWAGGSTWQSDGLCVMFDSIGARQWATYYGGNKDEYIAGCCFDASDNIYFTGQTFSANNISTPGSHQAVFGGNFDGFLVKLNSTGQRTWGTYYGGNKDDYTEQCAVDNSGNVYFTGYSLSSFNISSPGCHQPVYGGGTAIGDGIVVKFDPNGTRLWGTYYGGAGDDWTVGCSLDSLGNLYLAGMSTFGTPGVISTPGVHQSTYGGGTRDAFLLKMNSSGVRQWCTFYGGPGVDEAYYCVVSQNKYVYMCGICNSASGIATQCTYQENYGGGTKDVFLAKIDLNGVRSWGTYYGGSSYEDWVSCTTDLSGNVFLIGEIQGSNSTILSSPGSFQENYGGGAVDGFIAKFNGCLPPSYSDLANKTSICIGDTITLNGVSSCGTAWYEDSLTGPPIASGSIMVTPTMNVIYFLKDSTCGYNITTPIPVTVTAYPEVTVSVSDSISCRNSAITLTASGAMSYIWTIGTALSCSSCAMPAVSPTVTTDYCVDGANLSCVTSTCVTVFVDLNVEHNSTVPNAFTPNNDGVNDKFCLQGWDACIKDFKIVIYDRWGEKVFESGDPNFCWDGIYKGQLLSSDVYIYSLSATFKDDVIETKKGNITLIR